MYGSQSLKLIKIVLLTIGLWLCMTVSARTELDMHINFPPANFDTAHAILFAERVSERTNGEIVITVHHSGTLGLRGPEVMGAIRDGLVPMAHFHLDTAVGAAPFMGIQGLPYLATGFDQAKILDEIARPYYDEIAERNNQKILYSVFWPGAHVFSNRALTTLEDFRGLKIRTANASGTAFFNAIGASAYLMPWAEVVPALASGAIHGVNTSATSGVDGAFWEFQSHLLTLSAMNPAAVVAINLDTWNRLTPEQQAVIESTAAEIQEEVRAAARREDEKALAMLAERGMQVTEPSEELVTQLNHIAEALWVEWAEQTGESARMALQAYRERVGK